MQLSRIVHLIRITKGLSLESFAQRLGVTKGYIGHIESGKKSPGLHFLNDLSQGCGLPFTYIGMLMDLERLAKDEPALLDSGIESNETFAKVVGRARLEDEGLIQVQKRITNMQNVIIPRIGETHG